MKRKFLSMLFAAFISVAIISCGGSNNKSESTDNKEDIQTEYDIKCDNQIIYEGPGEDHGGIINEQATEIVGIETYFALWNDDRVELLSEENGWVEIKLVTGPNRVTGWVPESCLDR